MAKVIVDLNDVVRWAPSSRCCLLRPENIELETIRIIALPA